MKKRRAISPLERDKDSLAIRPGKEAPLSRSQVEFNRLMKGLEAARSRHLGEQARLDEALAIAIRELMPLVEDLNRVNRDIIFAGRKALQTLKLTAKRRHGFGDLLCGKAEDLLADPVGIGAEEIVRLQAIIEELDPRDEEEEMVDPDEMDHVRAMMEEAARVVGLDLDLSDLDPNGDPEEFQRLANERLKAAFEARANAPSDVERPRRKPTKAQHEKERKRLELEEAKNRDLKSLFKQLAKAFHPDLEPDPLLKEHKKLWMQRLNTAYAAADLREMLYLEMEWLGEEATNLATAGDAKLKVYCMVLKEQIAGLKRETHDLLYQPQYGTLRRFIDPYYGTLASPKTLKRDLRSMLEHHQEMLELLGRNDANARRLIYDLADEHAYRSGRPF